MDSELDPATAVLRTGLPQVRRHRSGALYAHDPLPNGDPAVWRRMWPQFHRPHQHRLTESQVLGPGWTDALLITPASAVDNQLRWTAPGDLTVQHRIAADGWPYLLISDATGPALDVKADHLLGLIAALAAAALCGDNQEATSG